MRAVTTSTSQPDRFDFRAFRSTGLPDEFSFPTSLQLLEVPCGDWLGHQVLPDVGATTGVGGAIYELRERAYKVVSEQLARLAAGESLLNVVGERGY